MNEIEIALSQLKFSPIVFDSGKYKTHVEAVENEDFIKLNLNYDYSENIGYFREVYYNANSVFESLKGIFKSKHHKMVLPYYHLDLNNEKILYEIHDDEDGYDEVECLSNYLYEILKNDCFIIKNNNKKVGKMDFLINFEQCIIEDLKNNLKVNNMRLIDVFNIIKRKGSDIKEIEKEINAENISIF